MYVDLKVIYYCPQSVILLGYNNKECAVRDVRSDYATSSSVLLPDGTLRKEYSGKDFRAINYLLKRKDN